MLRSIAEINERIRYFIEIIKTELLKLDTKPISYEDVLREDLEKFRKIERELLGKKYIAPFSLGIIEKYGFPETQVGTSNDIWVAYFPAGRFTLYMNKKNDEIVKVINDQLKKWWSILRQVNIFN